MLYRQRMHFFPKSQEARMELLGLGDEFNKLLADKGWTQARSGCRRPVRPRSSPSSTTRTLRPSSGRAYMFTEPDLMALGGRSGRSIPSTHPSEPLGPGAQLQLGGTFGRGLSASGVA